MEFLEAVSERYSAYMLDDGISDAGVTPERIVEVLQRIAPSVPSSYNSQSTRLIVLFGDDHRRLWKIVEDVLRAKVADEKRFKRTEIKMRNMAKAAGTVLFYEVDSITEKIAAENPSYAEQMKVWAEHGNAMMQFAVWTAMYDLGLGANIQHYNPIIDSQVSETFGIPEGYRLVSQLVFGRVSGDAMRKDKVPGTEIVTVGHAREL